MKKQSNWFAILWFILGIMFFVFATIDAINGDAEKSIGEMGISLACQARCEVKILERKIENNK